MENFLLPSKVEIVEGATPNIAEVIIMPCYHGYGTTLGNALRRVLLSSLPGSAVEYFKIDGVQHEFGAVEGVKEDVVEIMLNLKQLAVRIFSEEPVVLVLEKKGAGVVTAGDITANSNVEIINKDLVICNLTKNKPFRMEITVGHGRGYKPVEEKKHQNYDLGTMVVDSVYTPVKDVGYRVDYTRVGDITNYEKLVLTIETNGTISPREALKQSTQILMDHFSVISAEAGVEPERVVAEPTSEVAALAAAVGEKGDDAKEKKVKKEKKSVLKKGPKKKS